MSSTTLLVIAAIAFVVWHFRPERRPLKPTPKFRRERRAIANDPNWQTFINEHCESPAETAFLKAMIEAHNLLPSNGSLKADDIKIDFQVEVAQYRLDFLANDWLIIEIDGAAWHSSNKAKARDATRDSFFIELGYSVVRIPAKTVFTDPNEAVRRVSAALQIGKSVIIEPVQRSGFGRLHQTSSSANKLITELNASVDRQRRLAGALRPAELSYHTEKRVLESAVDAAERQIRIDDELGGDTQKRISYNAFVERFSNAFEESDRSDPKNITKQTITVHPYIRPTLSGNADIDREIDERFSRMSADRNAHFNTIREKLRNNPRLASLVRDNLAKFGCLQMYERISGAGTHPI